MRIRRVLAGIAGFCLLTQLALAAEKGVDIGWQPYSDSTEYELELGTSKALEPVLLREKYAKTEARVSLKPGVYYFRVRGISRSGEKGPWSETETFVVNPELPVPSEPKAGNVFAEKLEGGAIPFKWTGASDETSYLLELADSQGMTYRRTVSGAEYKWFPIGPGAYQWRIGTQGPAGDRWSPYSKFSVERAAVPSFEASASALPNEASPGSVERPSEWWVLGRLAQSVVVYNTVDHDTALNAAGAALVGLVSGELRWRQARSPEQTWTFSAALNFEMIRQLVLETEFTLPRGFARIFIGREYGPWRVGPFLQVGAGKSGIFEVNDNANIRSGTVFRENVGLGGSATYRPAPTFLLSALALIRVDTGGESPALPNPLSMTFAYEAGFGLGIELSHTFMLEGRLRALGESFSWKPATSAGTGNSSLNESFLILDGGIGIRL